jgi:hypothetical protein
VRIILDGVTYYNFGYSFAEAAAKIKTCRLGNLARARALFTSRHRKRLVPVAGLEPARCFHHLILSQVNDALIPTAVAADSRGIPGLVLA